MGVRFLNNLIKKTAPKAMKYVQLADYSGKTIVVDTSIYMHKYLGSNSLMESMYFMITQFKHLNITPIFVFDGVAPVEKQGVLTARENVRQSAIQRYNNLSRILEGAESPLETNTGGDADTTPTTTAVAVAVANDGLEPVLEMEMDEIHRRMHSLKKRFMRISNYEISEMKRLMREYDVHYIDCDGESDLVCAELVKRGIAQACMSDDMDLFLYGCPVVLRHVNIWYGTGIEYALSSVLNGLGISLRGFRMACVLSGTDYTVGCSKRDREDCDHVAADDQDSSSDSESVTATATATTTVQCGKRGSNVTRKIFHIYLSDIVKYYLEYTADSTESPDRYRFDEGFYDWVISTHFHGRLRKHVSEKELKIAKDMFQRAYAIFASEPSDQQALAIFKVRDAIMINNEIMEVDGGATSCIPYKVRRIMAKYNFIYI
jgi:5'-3' exonuclease